MNKKPLAIKIIVSLVIAYGIVNLVSNYIYAFYVHSGGFIDISFPLWFTLVFVIIPVIPFFISAFLIWRGGRVGYRVCQILFVLSFIPAVSGFYYLAINTPKLFNEDVLYLTKASPYSSWLLDNSIENFSSINNLMAYRILIIKSFIKAIIVVISCGYLVYVVGEGKRIFKIK